MTVINKKLADEIIKRILSVTQAEKIIIFGSAATGNMTKDSDIDILVIKKEVTDYWKDSVEIRDAIGELGYAIDLLIMTSLRFEETKNVIGGLAYPSNKYGKMIYDKAA